jgi:hypothetical protein
MEDINIQNGQREAEEKGKQRKEKTWEKDITLWQKKYTRTEKKRRDTNTCTHKELDTEKEKDKSK